MLLQEKLREVCDILAAQIRDNSYDGAISHVITEANAVLEQAENASDDPVRFAVFLDGGLVEEIYTDRPAKVIKIDMDIEGADEDEISRYPTQNNDTAKGCIIVNDSRDYPHCIVEENAEYVERLFKSQED